MRKSKPKQRIILPDPKYNDTLVTRFVNDFMIDGKKNLAYHIFYDAMDLIEEKTKKEPEHLVSSKSSSPPISGRSRILAMAKKYKTSRIG